MRILVVSGITNIGVVAHVEWLVREGHFVAVALEEGSAKEVASRTWQDLRSNGRIYEQSPGVLSPRTLGASLLTSFADLARPRLLVSTLVHLYESRPMGLRSGWLLLRLARLLSSAGREWDVIHVHDAAPGRRAAALARASFISGQLVVSFKGVDLTGFGAAQANIRYRRLFAVTSALTVQTCFMHEKLMQAGAPIEKVRVVPSPVDPSRCDWRPLRKDAEGEVRLIAVGRLIALKGHRYLIRALAIVREQGLPATLTIVGDGPLATDLLNLTRDLRLCAQVCFEGRVSRSRVYTLLAEHDIFIHPSITNSAGASEAMGLACLEAQATGLPCIATHSGGIPETIPSSGGSVLVPERDPVAIARAIHHLSRSRSSWPRTAISGREFVEKNFSISKVGPQLSGIYTELCGWPKD